VPREAAETLTHATLRVLAERLTGGEADARQGMVAVLATTRDAVEPGEFDDVLTQLGREYAELLGSAQ